jgi:hypothetical protein
VDCALQELECVLDEYRRGEVVSPQLIVPEHCIAKSPTARRRKFAFATAAAVGTLCLAGVFYAAAQEETSPAAPSAGPAEARRRGLLSTESD